MEQIVPRAKLITAIVVILGFAAGALALMTGVVYSHHPAAGKYLLAAFVWLSVVTAELYWRHEYRTHSWGFEGFFLLPSSTWILFFIVAAGYLLLGGDRKIALFTNGGLSVSQSADLARILLGS